MTNYVFTKHLDELNKAATFPAIPEDYKTNVLNKYGQKIDNVKKKVFEELPISGATKHKLEDIIINLFIRDIRSIESSELEYFAEYEPMRATGVVIAGFGDHDTFPSTATYEIEGMLLNHLIYSRLEDKSKTIDLEKLPAEIIPFAQTDMVEQFLNGVDQDYDSRFLWESCDIFEKAFQQIIDGDRKISKQDKLRLKKKLDKRLTSAIDKCMDASIQFQLHNHWWPTMRVVSVLPKSELATMAETLVNLTSFKRKVSTRRETVGGPIDVAVISRGDGFVWVKRKRYFPIDLNPGYIE